MNIENALVGVVGAGTMGLGIAQVAALHGHKTMLFDISEDAINRAQVQITKNLDKGIEKGKLDEAIKEVALSNLEFTTDLQKLRCDFIVEAVVEKLDIKRKIFAELEEINGEQSILASNTSSIPITQIGAELKVPGRFVGMHFFNPAHIMKLVEVIAGAATTEETVSLTASLCEKWGKKAVVAKDAPGFIVNRVARHYYVESLKILEEGVSDVETIDQLLEESGFKMGPFKLMDLIGVDTNFSVTETMFNAFYQDGKFRPSSIQKQKVDAGHHGRKSGQGFYKYDK